MTAQDYLILFMALLPVAILIFYIYRKDKASPEPAGQLVKAFLLGMLSVPLSLCLSIPLGDLGFYPDVPYTAQGALAYSFFGAAIPEELTKLLILWLFLRKNKYFDENMDGIVYAVCVSLGFAAVENIMYLFSNREIFVSVGIDRAIFSVPGHCCFGILMGYYYSLVKLYPKPLRRNRILLFAAPILAHGIYDSILFMMDVAPALSGMLTILLLYFCYRLLKLCRQSIAEHQNRDRSI